MKASRVVIAGLVLLLSVSGAGASTYPDTVESYQKISDTEGGFTGTLDDGDRFGSTVANLGDLDGDGIADLAVGANWDGDGGPQRGAVWILFLNADGTVKSHQKISSTEGGFTGALDDYDNLSWGLVNIGDLDNDGVVDLAAGATRDGDGGTDRGAVWILFLNTDGTVKAHQKISDTEGGFTGLLYDGDGFGFGLADIGDLDSDGVEDLAVSSYGDDDGGTNRGAVWVLFLNTDGTVKSHQKISSTEGGFTGVLHDHARFIYVACIGDLDGDGHRDLAVGELPDWGVPYEHPGKVWILFLNAGGTVRAHQEISSTAGGFGGVLHPRCNFGQRPAALGDIDGDGVRDMAVGAPTDNDGGSRHGAVWILLLNTDGTVKYETKISDTEGGFDGQLDYYNGFGQDLAGVVDLDGNGTEDRTLVVGAGIDDDGGLDRGAIWLLSLEGLGPPTSTVSVSQPAPAAGSTIAACIHIDMAPSTESLGSYGAQLTWNPAVLDFSSWEGGDASFDLPIVNTANVASGSLTFADASAAGAAGDVYVFCAEFDVIDAAGTSTTLDLELTSVFTAGTFLDMLPTDLDIDADVDVVLECTVGDVNGDGSINSGDALVILSDEIGLPIPPAFASRLDARCGDANGDGETNSTDANVILSFEVGLDVSGNPINGSNVTMDDCDVCGESAAACAAGGAASPPAGQVLADVIAGRRVSPGHPLEARIVVDTRPAGVPLGSYTARLEWDPQAIELLDTWGGSTPGFQSPMVNATGVANGVLRFTDANPYGAEGVVELLRVQYRLLRQVADPGQHLKLSFSSMATTGPGFERLDVVVGPGSPAPQP